MVPPHISGLTLRQLIHQAEKATKEVSQRARSRLVAHKCNQDFRKCGSARPIPRAITVVDFVRCHVEWIARRPCPLVKTFCCSVVVFSVVAAAVVVVVGSFNVNVVAVEPSRMCNMRLCAACCVEKHITISRTNYTRQHQHETNALESHQNWNLHQHKNAMSLPPTTNLMYPPFGHRLHSYPPIGHGIHPYTCSPTLTHSETMNNSELFIV